METVRNVGWKACFVHRSFQAVQDGVVEVKDQYYLSILHQLVDNNFLSSFEHSSAHHNPIVLGHHRSLCLLLHPF